MLPGTLDSSFGYISNAVSYQPGAPEPHKSNISTQSILERMNNPNDFKEMERFTRKYEERKRP